MTILEICASLKRELLHSGYEYGFWRDGRKYLPDPSGGFDATFYNQLLTQYRVQAPEDTQREKIGTCHDVALLMRAMLAGQGVDSRIWLLHDAQRERFHTVTTFEAEGKTVYLELTPQSHKPWYGKEIVYNDVAAFIAAHNDRGSEVIDVTDAVIAGEAPDFLLSRMKQNGGHS